MLQRTIDRDDLLTRIRIREMVLFGLIALTAVFANLPEESIQELGINPDYLVAALAGAVVIGLFLYLRFFFFLAVVLLILGANMPDQIAERLNVSKIPLLLALAAMIGISLINYVVKLMPTGLEPRPKEKSPEGVRAMFYAVEKNNVAYAQKVLKMNFDPNLRHDNGYTPLAYAAMKGNPQMVELLVQHGADPSLATREGDTPVELALRMGHTEVADPPTARAPGPGRAPGRGPVPGAQLGAGHGRARHRKPRFSGRTGRLQPAGIGGKMLYIYAV